MVLSLFDKLGINQNAFDSLAGPFVAILGGRRGTGKTSFPGTALFPVESKVGFAASSLFEIRALIALS
jgi:hypothetical protein